MTAWTDEQLAAFASGDLADAETAELRGALQEDPALASRLARIRRVDALLADLAPPAPSAAFSARLRAATDTAVAEVVGDELAARRARRQPTWTRWAAGGAAAVLALVVGTVVVTDLGGGASDEAAVTADGDGMELRADSAPAEADMAEDSAVAGMIAVSDLSPTVVDESEAFDDGRLPEITARVAERIGVVDPAVAADIAATNRQAFGAVDAVAETSESGASDDAASAMLVVVGDVDGDDRERVASCLQVVVDAADEAGDTVIPVEARLGTLADEDVIAFFLVSRDGDAFTRVETWVVARDTCEVRQLVQS